MVYVVVLVVGCSLCVCCLLVCDDVCVLYGYGLLLVFVVLVFC
jgi:hypothetical protein